ncbi:hypothetical protein VaNZ11_013176 [Volvox africanus]|uniref:AP2/ERF domain-containing protein n=1 Tax=Volvox africanus TaxID=51714 RepID=A0ABQ5SGP1_9CHLO|nr:hypothetical protein VaNZ11_013176 [Volvox africanus]
MATRASLARGTAPKEVYEGRVHKWERRWLVHKKGTVKTEAMLELLRWIVTDARCPELTGPRHPHIKPLKRPIIRQPSKKPPEQPTEQGGEPVTAAEAGAGAAAPGTAAQNTPAKVMEQSVVRTFTVAGGHDLVPAPGGNLPPLQGLDHLQTQAQAGMPQYVADATAAEDAALRGLGNALASQEPNSVTPMVGDDPRVAVHPKPGPREAVRTETYLPGGVDEPLASCIAEECDMEMTGTAAPS